MKVSDPIHKPHKGWFAIYEEELRLIERTFDSEATRRKVVAAYVASRRIANLEGAETFQRSISSIARDMGYSYNHAAEGFSLLKTVGLCDIQEQYVQGSKERAHSIYTIKSTLPLFGATLPPDGKSLEKQRVPKNSSKNSPNKKKEPPSPSRRGAHGGGKLRRWCSVSELVDLGYSEVEAEALDYFHKKLVPLGYLPVNKHSDEVVKSCEIFADDMESFSEFIDETEREGAPEKGDATFVRLGWNNY